MATRKTKFKISIEKLSFEFEGSQEVAQEVQQGIQQTLGGLLTTQARVLAHHDDSRVVEGRVLDGIAVPSAQGNGVAHVEAPEEPGEKVKPARPRRTRSGVSLKGMVRNQKQEGFFSQARSVADVQGRLKDRGHNFKSHHISTRLKELTQEGELYRSLTGEDGSYLYKDTPFDESVRNQGPADQPAE